MEGCQFSQIGRAQDVPDISLIRRTRWVMLRFCLIYSVFITLDQRAKKLKKYSIYSLNI